VYTLFVCDGCSLHLVCNVYVYVRVRAFIPPRLYVRFYTVVKYRTRYVTLRYVNEIHCDRFEGLCRV